MDHDAGGLVDDDERVVLQTTVMGATGLAPSAGAARATVDIPYRPGRASIVRPCAPVA
jgi:hypothetical protein